MTHRMPDIFINEVRYCESTEFLGESEWAGL